MNFRLAILTAATAFISVGNNLATAQPVPGPAAGTSSAGTDITEGSQPIGFGKGTGMGAGGFVGSASSLAGGFGSTSNGSGSGSQGFGGGFTQQQAPFSGPLASPKPVSGPVAGPTAGTGTAMQPR